MTNYNVVSTDDHVLEPPDLWEKRLPKKFKEDCPHVVRDEGGVDHWIIAGKDIGNAWSRCAAALPDRTQSIKNWDEVPDIVKEPAARLKAMDQDGVDVHIIFPQITGFGGATFSGTIGGEEFRLACIQAYNDYLVEEWYGHSHRFVPQCVIPMWDAEQAATEVARAAKLGHRALIWSGKPEALGYPHFADPYWDPLWNTVQDLDMMTALHIGGAGVGGLQNTYPGYEPMRRLALISAQAISSNSSILANVLFSGVLERFPGLKMITIESGLGWIPHLLEVCDHQYQQQRLPQLGMAIKPSELFKRQCYANFWFEEAGIAMRHLIGVDNILWESDFPHGTSTYPNSKEFIEKGLKGVPEEERRKMLAENAIRLYHLD